MTPPARSARAAEFGARVIASYGRQFLIERENGAVLAATRRGKKGDVVVGDEVVAQAAAAGQARIEQIRPRRSLLFRADAFRVKELAANIDRVFVVYAARPSFNRWFVWKALVAASAARIDAMVVQNKIDLDDGGDAAAFRASLDALGVPTLALSAKRSPDETRRTLSAETKDRASLLVGQSGMGKSTILNLLVPDAGARTQEYSQRLDVGKQTTTSSRWFPLPGGGSIVDSPGFHAFGIAHVPLSELAQAFPDFRSALGYCRFADCRHLAEPGCAVREQLESGAIAGERYAFYRSLAEARPL